MSLAASKRDLSSASLPKALAVRMPERLDSISVLMWPVFCLTPWETLPRLLRMDIMTTKNTGTRMATTSASSQRIQAMTIRAPRMVMVEVSTSSGPW